jgi:hypothetical protein
MLNAFGFFYFFEEVIPLVLELGGSLALDWRVGVVLPSEIEV